LSDLELPFHASRAISAVAELFVFYLCDAVCDQCVWIGCVVSCFTVAVSHSTSNCRQCRRYCT